MAVFINFVQSYEIKNTFLFLSFKSTPVQRAGAAGAASQVLHFLLSSLGFGGEGGGATWSASNQGHRGQLINCFYLHSLRFLVCLASVTHHGPRCATPLTAL